MAIKLAAIDDLLAGRCGELAVGDVLAFNGTTRVDEFIQEATHSGIAHVAILMRAKTDGPLLLLEATGKGITATPLAEALEGYKADHTCFYLPLRAASRALVDPATLAAYYASNAGDKYNYDGVVAAGLYDLEHPLFDKLFAHHGGRLLRRLVRWWYKVTGRTHKLWRELFDAEPEYRRLFCSQLVAEVLHKMKIIGAEPPARVVVPVQVGWLGIYGPVYQVGGDALLPEPFRWPEAPAGMQPPDV
jgi:hypothetical protein